MSTATDSTSQDAQALMHSIIQRVATGPELSKDISQAEARAGMRAILEGQIDPVRAAIFLIALRMKRETDDENMGVLDGIRDLTHSVTAPVDEVVDIADPYDGYNRTLPASPFLPLVLAECGVPAISQGVESVGPKYGLTHHQVLHAAGIAVDLSPEDAAARLADPAIGWSYVDQRQFCPALHDLLDLRTRIIKRPSITTVEVLTGPVRGRKKTHLVTGFVHKPYPRIYAMLARHAGFDSCLLVRGIEGGVVPSLRQAGAVCHYHDRGEEHMVDIDPTTIGIEQQLRAVPVPEQYMAQKASGSVATMTDTTAVAKVAVESGLEALEGKPGATRDALIYSAALCLWHLKKHTTLGAAADAVREVLASGRAVKRLK